MAYPNQYYFPQNYQSLYQPQQVQQVQQMQQPQQMQIQNGGFISIRGEQEARNYPVASGMSITFKDETAPYIYTKTMGFSQLDLPQFEKYRLVKEETSIEEHTKEDVVDMSIYAKNDQIEDLKSQIEELKSQIEDLKIKKNKKEATKDD